MIKALRKLGIEGKFLNTRSFITTFPCICIVSSIDFINGFDVLNVNEF
jgi:hypothetical protein